MIALGVGLLALVGGVIFVVAGKGSSKAATPGAPGTPGTSSTAWIPTGPPAASSDVWKEALRRWQAPSGAGEAARFEANAAAIRRAPDAERKAYRKAASDYLRAGASESSPIARLVKAVDGSVWRARPVFKAARWKGLDAYRVLEPYADGALVAPGAVSTVDAAIATLVRYDEQVVSDVHAKSKDATRALADPDGRGFAIDQEGEEIWWLAAKGASGASGTGGSSGATVVDATAAQAQCKLHTAAMQFAWPFASTKPFDLAFGSRRLVLVLDPAAKRYDGLGEENDALLGVGRVPYGDSVESRLAAATALVLSAYDAAFRLDCSRNRENLRHALAMRWGMAFAVYESDVKPDSFPVMRDRGRDALKKALGTSPNVPPWGVVLDAALQEDVYRADDARVVDLDPVRRAAYVFLAYRMIMRWRIMDPWSETQMRALAEEKPIPFDEASHDPKAAKRSDGITWSEFAKRLKAIADDPEAALRTRGGAQWVALNYSFAERYVPWVLAGEPAGGGNIDGR